MAEISKVTLGLELCAYDPDPGQTRKDVHSCSRCPYYDHGCEGQLYRDALALLKEQEPRVMTEGDVLHSTGKPVWFESRGMYLGQKGFWCLLFEVDAELHIRFVQSVTGGKITLSLIDYDKIWRFWTSRPDEQVRRDTPWES